MSKPKITRMDSPITGKNSIWHVDVDERGDIPAQINIQHKYDPLWTFVWQFGVPDYGCNKHGLTFEVAMAQRVFLWVAMVTLYQQEGGRTFKARADLGGRHVPGMFLLGIETMHGAVGIAVLERYWEQMQNVPTLSIAPVEFPYSEEDIDQAIEDATDYVIWNKGYLHGDGRLGTSADWDDWDDWLMSMDDDWDDLADVYERAR